MTIKTKASRRARLFKGKTSFLDVDSRVQLDDTGPAFYSTSFLVVETQHHKGVWLKVCSFSVMRFSSSHCSRSQNIRAAVSFFFIPLLDERSRGGSGLPRVYFLFLAEGQRGSQAQRVHSGEYGSQESNHSRTQPRIGEPTAARGALCRLLLALLHHTCHTRLGL